MASYSEWFLIIKWTVVFVKSRQVEVTVLEEPEKTSGASLKIAGGVVRPLIRAPEQVEMELVECRPLEPRPLQSRQAANLGGRLHRADRGDIEQAGTLLHADEFGGDDAAIEVDIMGNNGDGGGFYCRSEFIQDANKVLPFRDGPGMGDSMDLRRFGGDGEPVGTDDMGTNIQQIPPKIVHPPGQLDQTRPSLNLPGREIPTQGQPCRFAIEKQELRFCHPDDFELILAQPRTIRKTTPKKVKNVLACYPFVEQEGRFDDTSKTLKIISGNFQYRNPGSSAIFRATGGPG